MIGYVLSKSLLKEYLQTLAPLHPFRMKVFFLFCQKARVPVRSSAGGDSAARGPAGAGEGMVSAAQGKDGGLTLLCVSSALRRAAGGSVVSTGL